MRQSIYLRIHSVQRQNERYQLYNRRQTTENKCRKSSSREFRRRSRFHSYGLHRKRCEPRWRTRRWKRPSKSEILLIRLLSRLSTEQPEPGASSTRFGRGDPPRSSRQWRCRRKPNDRKHEEILQSEGDQQSEISQARGKQQDCDSVEQQSSAQDPGAHSQPKQKLTRHHRSLRCHEQGVVQQSADPIE